jgi:hypothetical protein
MTDLIEWLGTERLGQLTGSRDPQGRLLINVTTSWGVEGVDLGANTEHDGRLYFFFGDVATTDNGEHRPEGWSFFLPNDHQGATDAIGQKDWRFCSRCHSLFWAPGGDTSGSFCPQGGEHYFHPDSWNFFLPNDHQGATPNTGQPGWRFCGKCHGLCWAPGGVASGSACPKDGQAHEIPDGSWVFVLPNDMQGATPATGQPEWRLCRKCLSLAWFPDERAAGSCCAAGNARNADLVAWTDDKAVTPPRPAGHHEAGWTFALPNDHQGAISTTGQPDWRFCGKCSGLFWAPGGDPSYSVCPADGGLHAAPDGSWIFYLPNDHQGATEANGQTDWRICDKCHGLFWAPGDVVSATVCPVKGGWHSFNPQSWRFVLPNREHGASDNLGQAGWRFCDRCCGLFWNGDSGHGVCPAGNGGGIRLHPVMKPSGVEFDQLIADWPVGVTKSLELSGGAFSHNGRAHAFVNISPERWSEHQRPGNPQYGTYLISKPDPSSPGPYRVEYLFSPRIGACPSHDGLIESHVPLGYRFVMPHDLTDDVPRQTGWRRCVQCMAMFFDARGDGVGGLCWDTGGPHTANPQPAARFDYALPLAPGPSGTQAAWRRCGNCETLYWDGSPDGKRGQCPAGGEHARTEPELALPHLAELDNPNQLSQWRFCVNCAGLFWTGDFIVRDEDNRCAKTGGTHELAGLDFVLPHDISETEQRLGGWRQCGRCALLYWAGASDPPAPAGVCPAGGNHTAGNATAPPGNPACYDFVIPRDVPVAPDSQGGWRPCRKCTAMFWGGHPTGGFCAADGGSHEAGTPLAQPGPEFVLPHCGPGPDAQNEGDWRFCTRCFELVWTGHPDRFSGVAPTVVRAADHQDFLPNTDTEYTLVMACFGFAPNTAIRLAYMPLRPGREPSLRDVRYHSRHASGNAQWTPDAELAADLFPHTGYTSLSASWQRGPRRWLLLYSNAHDDDPNAFANNAVARIAETPPQWVDAAETTIFDPADAYGIYMHQPGCDDIDKRVPPNDGHKGWPYGPHLLDRYTTWNEDRRELDIYYLLSLSVPYQVQLMHTRLRITPF